MEIIRKSFFWSAVILMILLSVSCESDRDKALNTNRKTGVGQIDSIFQDHFKKDLFHGGVSISHRSEIIYENYLGVADRAWNISLDKDTRFDIASLNKSMIAALVLKAVEDDLLKLDETLVNLLNDFEYDGNFHPDITLHHLLCHSSGLADYDGVSDDLKKDNFKKFKRSSFTNQEYVNFISKITPINKPGQEFYYSNFAYHLVAIILENTYSKTFAQILEENLTSPLGLSNTVSMTDNDQIISNLATGYLYEESTEQWLKNPFIDMSLGRRIFSTPSDLNRWAQVMDNPGYLSASSLKLMTQNHLTEISKNVSYGYGWVTVDEEHKSTMGDLGIDKPYIIHGGSTDGYKAILVNVNGGEYVISIVSNSGNRTNEMDLARKIVSILN